MPTAPVEDQTNDGVLRPGTLVEAVEDLPGVPAGTRGVVVGVAGLTWVRYRVRFDNGAELGTLDRKLLVPVGRKRGLW